MNIAPKIAEQLDQAVERYNQPSFIADDPISIPHRFHLHQDIEIAGILSATIAWGKRSMILNNAGKLMERMDHAPYDFVRNAQEKELQALEGFVHRTFNTDDLLFFMEGLKRIYAQYDSLEAVFYNGYKEEGSIKAAIENFRNEMFAAPHMDRSRKHISSPARGSAAKRINMFLRWMVRKDNKGVDFGIWKNLPMSALMCPLDVHSGRVARHFGLLQRRQDDWKAVEELNQALRLLDPSDPVKYDFALFGIGVNQ